MVIADIAYSNQMTGLQKDVRGYNLPVFIHFTPHNVVK
jgi:hypothetical protein